MRALALALAAALFALLANLPWIGRGELESEEARRALPAQAMLSSAAGDHGAWIVPRLWGEPYLAKPPLYFWWVALHQVALERSGLDERWRPTRTEPGWWPQGRVGPLAVRGAAATSAALLAALVAYVVTRTSDRNAGARGFLAGALIVVAPEMLAKAPLGEIETTLALWCAVAAVGLGAVALRPSIASAALGAIGLGGALLAKGPIAVIFALAPALTFAVARVGWRAALVRVGGTGAVGLALFLWWPLAVRNVVEEGAALERWAAEISRGETGGLRTYLGDRVRLVGGLLAGFAPAALLALDVRRRARREVLKQDPITHFALHALVWGLLVLMLWPGVRPRYGLPLVAATAVLGAARLCDGSSPRAARVTALAVGGVALLLPPVALVLCWRAKPDALATSLPSLGALEYALLGASTIAGAVVLLRGRESSGRGLLVGAVVAFLLARSVHLGVLERTRTDHRRAAAAEHIEHLAPSGVATDVWGNFNELYYLTVPVRFVHDPTRDVEPGEVLLTESGRGLDLAPPEWIALPLFEAPGWSGAPRTKSLRTAELWRRAIEARTGD